jgi:hypothetical protein
LIYFTAIWNILGAFGIFYGRLVQFEFVWYISSGFGTFWYISSGFGIVWHEKSGNPGLGWMPLVWHTTQLRSKFATIHLKCGRFQLD